jgi:3-dehydroquinate synthase
MKTTRILPPPISSRSYRVLPCSGPAEIARRLAKVAGGERIFLVTDRNVMRHHGRDLETMLDREGADYRTFVLPPGERTKVRRMRDALEDRMLRSGAERNSLVAAFGGGVIGDLAGFAASTILRGVRLVQVPTTLVAQADSAVGGKVGIDHPRGKNLLGAFHHPEAVLLFPGYLRTLPGREFLQGMAEVVKYGAVLDRRLFERLRADAAPILSRRPAALAPVIARCCELKGRLVRIDERDTGERRLLNFGHTIGHALEHASGHRIAHGMAVSIGMAVEAGIARELGILPAREFPKLLELLGRYSLPVSIPRGIDRGLLLDAVARDKKAARGDVRFTLLRRIGAGVAGVVVPGELIGKAIGR